MTHAADNGEECRHGAIRLQVSGWWWRVGGQRARSAACRFGGVFAGIGGGGGERIGRLSRKAVGSLERGFEFGLEGGGSWFIGAVVAAEGRPSQAGRDLKGTGHLSQRHFFDFAVAEVFEEASDGLQEFLTGGPLLLAKGAEASGPIGGVTALQGGLGFEPGLEQSGLAGMKAVTPVEAAGPLFDGGRLFAEGFGDGREGAGGAESVPGEESAEGPRGLTEVAGEEGLIRLGRALAQQGVEGLRPAGIKRQRAEGGCVRGGRRVDGVDEIRC